MATTATKRYWYRAFRCSFEGAKPIELEINGERGGPIHPMFHDIWFAFSRVLSASGRSTHSAWSYVCRSATGSILPSLHSYVGLARDENPREGPFRRTPTLRALRWSDFPTQEQRALDVSRGNADTTYRRVEVERLLAIRFRCGHGTPAFTWGGNFRTVKDAMHWEIDHPPECVLLGVDWSTVYGNGELEEYVMKQDDPHGMGIQRVQEGLEGWQPGVLDPWGADGWFGQVTEDAVVEFQTDHTLPATGVVDGVLAGLILSYRTG